SHMRQHWMRLLRSSLGSCSIFGVHFSTTLQEKCPALRLRATVVCGCALAALTATVRARCKVSSQRSVSEHQSCTLPQNNRLVISWERARTVCHSPTFRVGCERPTMAC